MTTATRNRFHASADELVEQLVATLGWDEAKARRHVLAFADTLITESAGRVCPPSEVAAMRADSVDQLAAHWGIDR